MNDTVIIKDAIVIAMVGIRQPGNIGAAARAMKTMGLHKLRLVAPHEFPSKQADYMAVHAKSILNTATLHTTLTEATQDTQLIIGTSARQRTMPVPVVDAEQATYIASRYARANKRVVFVFGREDSGLTNEELQGCHLHMQIDTDEAYNVLNVAAAVQIVGYLLRQASKQKHTAESAGAVVFNARWDEPLCTDTEFRYFMQHLETLLIQVGVQDKNKSSHFLLSRFKRLFSRVHLDATEVGLLRGLLTAIQKQLGYASSRPNT